MWGVVLVGGFGTRLRPLTLTRPKQMLPIVDRPMIEHVVAGLGANGVTDVVLSLGYRADVFEAAYPSGTCAGVRLHYAVEPEPLDTAGAIRFAADRVDIDETFIALNGDVMTDLSIDHLVALHRASDAQATIALTPVEDPSRYGVVPIDADNRVIEFVEKPPPGTAPSNWINAGTYVLEPSVLELISAGVKTSIERQTFPRLAEAGSLYAMQSDCYWIDTGTPQTYIDAQLDLCGDRRGRAATPIHPTASIDPSAVIQNSVVMQGASVCADAVIEDSIISEHATVGLGARIRESIVGQQAHIGAGASLSKLSVIGDGEVVAPNVALSAARQPAPT